MTTAAPATGGPAEASLDGFRPVAGVHCETTMLNNMLRHAGIEVSEALVFGLGQGIDAQYYPPPPHTPAPPMLTGRIDPGHIVTNACEAMGLHLVSSQPDTDEAAHEEAAAALAAGHVVGVTVDIFHLDYFESRVHFSAHCIALHGLNHSTAHVVDTAQQGGAQQLPRHSLTAARASDEGFLPSPRRQWYLAPPVDPLLDGATDLADQVWPAIQGAARHYLDRNRGEDRGIRALHRAAEDLPSWASLPGTDAMIPQMANFWRFAGTGGTNFRGLYLEFLTEGLALTGDAALEPGIARLLGVNTAWSDLIDHLIDYPGAADRAAHLREAATRLHTIADAEDAAFTELAAHARDRLSRAIAP